MQLSLATTYLAFPSVLKIDGRTAAPVRTKRPSVEMHIQQRTAFTVYVCLKVKFTLEQATKAQKPSRGIASRWFRASAAK